MTRPDQTRPDQLIARNSSLELLRIVAMLMIVAHHFAVHGGFSFPAGSITLNRIWQKFIFMGGSLGNDIFVLISGYFLVKSHSLKLHRIFDLWLRVFFYSVTIYSIFLLSGMKTFDLKTALIILLPITKAQWWFASTYFVLYLIHPYVNTLLFSFNREDYRKFIMTIMLYWCIIPMVTKSSFQSNALINFVCLYSLAGYVRLWADDFGSRKFIWFGIGFIALNFISTVVLRNYMLGMMRPFTIAATLCLLIGFKHLNIRQNSIINTIASATFGVYLIHDNNFVRPFLWRELFRNATFQESPYLIPYSIAVIIIVYVSCTLIELIRIKLFRTLSGGRFS